MLWILPCYTENPYLFSIGHPVRMDRDALSLQENMTHNKTQGQFKAGNGKKLMKESKDIL